MCITFKAFLREIINLLFTGSRWLSKVICWTTLISFRRTSSPSLPHRSLACRYIWWPKRKRVREQIKQWVHEKTFAPQSQKKMTIHLSYLWCIHIKEAEAWGGWGLLTAISSSSRTWVYQKLVFVRVGSELVSMAAYQHVHVHLALHHSQGVDITPRDNSVSVDKTKLQIAYFHDLSPQRKSKR